MGYSPGQEFVKPFREFFERTRFWEMEPAPERVENGTGFALASASELVAYLPNGGSVTLNLIDLKGAFTARWFNPRDGNFTEQVEVDGGVMREFQAPDGNDWILYLRKGDG